MPKVTMSAQVSWSGEGVRSIASIRKHQVTIDEPKSLGGTDKGPNPVELILAALGGCLNVLLASLAPRHEVELRGVQIDVEGDLDPDGYMERNPNVRTGLQEVRYRVTVDSPSDPEKVQALIEHAERLCPVKDTLSGVTIKAMEGQK